MVSENIKNEFLKRLNNITREGSEHLKKWILNNTDYETAPASSRYHSNFEGGWILHSIKVMDIFSEKNKIYNLGLSEESVTICALLHDLCKLNFYKIDYKNKKIDGEWTKVPFYTTDEKFPAGHGCKSVIIMQQFMKLTPEEILAIEWHMGGYSSPQDYNSISNAWYKYKSGVCLHTSDLEATYIFEKIIND